MTALECSSKQNQHATGRICFCGSYEILNYQPYYTTDNNLTYKYVTIGRWTMGNLELNESAIYWPGKDHTKAFRSACSEPCKVGFVKVSRRDPAAPKLLLVPVNSGNPSFSKPTPFSCPPTLSPHHLRGGGKMEVI